MEAVRIKTARERSNVQNKVTDLKSMIIKYPAKVQG